MKDFASVGRGLRHYRSTAFFFLAVATFISALGVAAFLDHGPPMAWKLDPATHESTNALLSPNDPEYEAVLRQRWHQLSYFLFWAGGVGALGLLALAASRKAPAKEVLHLAQARKGVLTLPEVSTALDIDPQLAAKALVQLQKLKIAVPRWQDIRRNIWEFPDYMEMPPSPEFAHDGTLPMERPVAPSASRQVVPPLASEAAPAQMETSATMGPMLTTE